MKKAAHIFAIFFSAAAVFSQNFSPSAGEGGVLTLVVREALQNLREGDFDAAQKLADFGSKIDGDCADIYFVRAKISAAKNEKRADIVSNLEAAFDGRKWILADESEARIFFAQNLAAVRRFGEALSVLPADLGGFSADAEFCRAQCLFALGKKDEALSQIQSSASAFWRDARFPVLFFKNADEKNLSEGEKSLAQKFLQNADFFARENPAVFLFAAQFCGDEILRQNFLQKYKSAAKELSARYFLLALQNGAESEQDALDFFVRSKKVEFSALADFALLISDDAVREQFSQFLANFSGEILFDDGEIRAIYENGRIFFAERDANFDGIAEWSAKFEHGAPFEAKVFSQNLRLEYGEFPLVKSAQEDGIFCEIAANSLECSPFFIKNADFSQIQAEFPIPVPSDAPFFLSKDELLAKSSKILTKIDGKKAEFLLRDGKIERAKYFDGKKLFAQGNFEGGALKSRSVDKDGDGFFETEEFYGLSAENPPSEESRAFAAALFGELGAPEGLRLEKIRVDLSREGGGVFVEEYSAAGGRAASWDGGQGGGWQSRQVLEGDFERREFIHPLSKNVVSIDFEKGIPQTFADGRGKWQIVRDERHPIYWLGEPSRAENAEKIMAECAAGGANMSVVLGEGGERFLAFRFGDDFFAEAVPQ